MAPRHASATRPRDATAADIAQDVKESPRVQVLLPLPLEGAYDYLAPESLELAAGDVVLVPLGGREVAGVVWEETARAGESLPVKRLKSVIERFPVPPLPAVERRFLEWLANYSLVPLGTALRLALRVGDALLEPAPQRAVRRSEGALPANLRMTPARRRVLDESDGGPARPQSDLARAAGVSSGVVKALLEAGALEEVALPPPGFKEPDWRRPGPALSQAQESAAAELRERVESREFSVTLLDGVTGSGKTEVYFEALAALLCSGRQGLVLLPEIALSAAWLERFEERFGVRPALWHSELSQRERRIAWRAVAEGRARIVVGARSALFLPFPDLGLIVIDEEQDSSFKQDDGVVYHARDMAIVRARLGAFPAILVSATPSLETLVNVEQGRYRQLHLPERHGSATLPPVSVIDLRREPPPAVPGLGQGWLSPPLRAAIVETLAEGEQVLLFLNRRGYAPLTLCRTCGYRLQCPNCTAWLVDHRLTGRLICHHCGHTSAPPQNCPACSAENSFAACGPGVERLAEEVRHLYPDARTALLSSDTLAGPRAASELLRAVAERAVDIVIGTQVVAKGHNFPFLTLVGAIDADLGLYGGDLRAVERTFQLLYQVAGRAGRAERPGRVLIQTHEPEHPVMQALARHDRDGLMTLESEMRQRNGLPPFGRLAAVILSGSDPELLDRFARRLARVAPRRQGVTILGPAPAPLALLRGRHRRRFLVKTRRDILPQEILRHWLAKVELPNALRLQVDIDPYSFL